VRSTAGIGAALVTAIATVAGIGLSGPLAAQAASAPVVYTCGMGPHWGCPAVRPRTMVFGAHFELAGMSWVRWDSGSAFGHATVFYPWGYRRDAVTLAFVRTHNGRRYFAQVKVVSAGHPTKYVHMTGSGLWALGRA